MTEKKRVYKSEVMALPAFRTVLGDNIPSPDPVRRSLPARTDGDMRLAVSKLIGYLKEEKKPAGYF